MSRGYWYTLIAVVGWLTTSQALAVPPKAERHSDATSEHNSQTAPAVEQVPTPIVLQPSIESPLQKMVDEISKANERANNDKHDEKDLVAQESMATSTHWIMWFTGAQIFLTLFGTWLVWRSLTLTRVAVNAAVEGNTHTIAANEQQRISSQRQLRAYMTVSDCSYQALDDGYLLSVKIRNSGQTPAFNVRHMSESYAGEYPDGGDRPHLEVPGTHATPVGPGEALECARRLYVGDPAEVLTRLSKREIGLWIQGTALYEDCFENPRYLKFRYVLRGERTGEGILLQMHGDKYGNEAN